MTVTVPHARHRIRPWAAVAMAVFYIGWGGNQFTPLLGSYTEHAGYTRVDVDLLLGAYVLGLVPGLLLTSVLSDRHGRRRTMVGGVLAAAVGSIVIAVGGVGGFGALFTGRVCSGLSVGIAMAVGSAWITELSAPPHSSAGRAAGARRSAIWLSMGLGFGPVSSGLLGTFAPQPLVLTFVVHAVLSIPVLWAVTRRTIETRSEPSTGGLRDGLRVPAAGHRRFVHVVAPMAPWIFGSAAIAYAIVPSLVAGRLGSWSLLFTAGITVLTLGCGVAVQPIARRLDDQSSARAIVVSMALMAVGVFASVLAAVTRSATIAVIVAMLLGAAYGIAVVSGLLEVQRIAEPDDLAGITGVYYSLAYVGFLLPALLAALAHDVGYPWMLGALGVLATLCAATCASGWSKHLPSRTNSPGTPVLHPTGQVDAPSRRTAAERASIGSP